MKLVLVSSDVLWDKSQNSPYEGIQATLDSVLKDGNDVFLVSSHAEPPWLKKLSPRGTITRDIIAEGQKGSPPVDTGTVDPGPNGSTKISASYSPRDFSPHQRSNRDPRPPCDAA